MKEDNPSETKDILLNLFGSSTSSHSDEEDSDSEVESDFSNAEAKTVLSAVVEMVAMGGSRGLISLREIPPGILLLAEIPIVTWNDNTFEEEENLRRTIEACLMDELAYRTTKSLHPKMLKDCDTEEIERAETLLGSPTLNEIAHKVGVSQEEVLRVLLVLQHNGFGSGLYGVLTMLNHSCDPNCIKFPPSTGSSGASEVWTVRQIREGEELTICYCEPLEMTNESIREYLELHHRFHCKCSVCVSAAIYENSLPEQEQHFLRKSHSLGRNLQEIVVGMEQELLFLRNLDDSEVGFESLARLMKATTDLSAVESDENTGDNMSVSPRVLARLCKLAANTAVTFLEYANKSSEQRRRPKGVLLKMATFSFLRNSLLLMSHQLKYLDAHHPDMASSHIDIAEALDCALKFYQEDLVIALNAPVDENYSELKLLKILCRKEGIAEDTWSGEGQFRMVRVTKDIIKKESNRFRAEGAIIKNLYSRSHFPSRYVTLRHNLPGICHWGDFVPVGHSKFFSVNK